MTEMIDRAFHSGSHAYTLDEIHHVGGFILRVAIKRDYYIAQSYAKVEVLNTQLTWTDLTSMSPNTWHKDTPSTTKDATPLSDIVTLLIERGYRILSIYATYRTFNDFCSDSAYNGCNHRHNRDRDYDLDVDIEVGPEFAATLDAVTQRKSLDKTTGTQNNNSDSGDDDDSSSDDKNGTTAMDALILGERIRHAREIAGLKQSDLGQAVGLERTVIGRIEAGTRRVTALELADISAALGVRMSTFFQ